MCVFVRTVREQELSQGNIYVIEVLFYIRKKKGEKKPELCIWDSGVTLSLKAFQMYRHGLPEEAPSRVDAMNGQFLWSL